MTPRSRSDSAAPTSSRPPPPALPAAAASTLRLCFLQAQCCSKLARPQQVTLQTCAARAAGFRVCKAGAPAAGHLTGPRSGTRKGSLLDLDESTNGVECSAWSVLRKCKQDCERHAGCRNGASASATAVLPDCFQSDSETSPLHGTADAVAAATAAAAAELKGCACQTTWSLRQTSPLKALAWPPGARALTPKSLKPSTLDTHPTGAGVLPPGRAAATPWDRPTPKP